MVSFRITKNGFIGNGSGSLTGSLLGTASHAIIASSVAWNDVTGKPSTYPAAAHDHTGDNLKPASVSTTGDVTVGGNLIVNGSQTVIKTKNLTVKDKLIEIASGSTTKAMIDGAGIQFGEASLNASIKYENSGSTGAFVSPIDIHAPNIDLNITSISASAVAAEKYATNAGKSATNAATYEANAKTSANSAASSATAAKASANSAASYTANASASMQDARLYSSQAATNATNASTYAVQSSASAFLAAESASAAATSANSAKTSATNASGYATNASTSANNAASSASAAKTSATNAANAAAEANTYKSNAKSSADVAANWAASASVSANIIDKNADIAKNWAASSSVSATSASASAALLYRDLGSETQPIYLTTAGPQLAKKYSEAEVKSAGFATSASYASASTTASYALIAEAVKDGAGLVVNTASFALDHYIPSVSSASVGSSNSRTYIKTISLDKNKHVVGVTTGTETVENTDTKVTSAANHYTPAQAGTSGSSTARYYIKTIGVDSRGHVTSVTTGNETVVNTDTKVTSVANHYKAANQISGSQGGTNATYIHAITLDAAGHVTAVSTTNTSSITAGNSLKLGGQTAANYALKSYVDSNFLPITGGTVTGDLVVQGNMSINGVASVIDQTHLNVADTLVLLASGSTSQAAANGAGIAIQTSSATTQEDREAASARIQYRSSDNHFTASVGFVAPSFTGSLQGTATHAKLAESAEKLSTSNVGGTGEPVYFKNGVPEVDAKTKGVVDWVTINSESLLTPDEVIWKKGTGTDSVVRALSGNLETLTPSATGIGAVAIGLATVASGTGSHAEGMVVAASGICSHAEGQSTVASGLASHAEGFYTTASGDYSHAEGSGSIASGRYSHAEGLRTTASGEYSHVEGYGTDAGDYSHAEGTSTKASGTSNHAEGLSTEAIGYASHAEGCSTTASGDYSHAEGFGTTTSNIHEHAQGMYNHTSSNQIFSIGAGNSDTDRKNAVSVLAVKNNNKYTSSFFVQNVGGYDGTNPTPGTNDLATVINGITANAGTVTSVGVSAGTGITASVTNATTTPTISISSAQAHTHDNKAVLDGITAAMTASWTSKQDAITDLATIKSNAANGKTAYGWGNHASAGYVKSGDITTAINNLVTVSGSKWSTDTQVTAVGNHYTPKQSTAKTASAGSVISGIGLDAAGHVTSITSSNSISNATTATNLGVVGNTSASVAAAIAEKWTYDEDTIKGVEVNKAVSATKLVGTSGSVGVPVYISAGVPKACQANLVSLPLSSTGATTGTVTLAPGKVHNCGTLTGNLTVELDASSTDSHEAIYCCVFNMGSTLRTITLPTGVKVVENSADLDTTGVYYEINIMNNVAIIARTSAS